MINYFLGRAETFHRKVAVHMPPQELHYPGHCRLKETNDKMQTALNAYAIFLYCSAKDIEKLSPQYVLRSVRTFQFVEIYLRLVRLADRQINTLFIGSNHSHDENSKGEAGGYMEGSEGQSQDDRDPTLDSGDVQTSIQVSRWPRNGSSKFE